MMLSGECGIAFVVRDGGLCRHGTAKQRLRSARYIAHPEGRETGFADSFCDRPYQQGAIGADLK